MIAVQEAGPVQRALDTPRVTLGEMAERLGVSRSALEKYREGKTPMPHRVRARLAVLLRAHATELHQVAEALVDADPAHAHEGEA